MMSINYKSVQIGLLLLYYLLILSLIFLLQHFKDVSNPFLGHVVLLSLAALFGNFSIPVRRLMMFYWR